jgi:hypothetical protein
MAPLALNATLFKTTPKKASSLPFQDLKALGSKIKNLRNNPASLKFLEEDVQIQLRYLSNQLENLDNNLKNEIWNVTQLNIRELSNLLGLLTLKNPQADLLKLTDQKFQDLVELKSCLKNQKLWELSNTIVQEITQKLNPFSPPNNLSSHCPNYIHAIAQVYGEPYQPYNAMIRVVGAAALLKFKSENKTDSFKLNSDNIYYAGNHIAGMCRDGLIFYENRNSVSHFGPGTPMSGSVPVFNGSIEKSLSEGIEKGYLDPLAIAIYKANPCDSEISWQMACVAAGINVKWNQKQMDAFDWLMNEELPKCLSELKNIIKEELSNPLKTELKFLMDNLKKSLYYYKDGTSEDDNNIDLCVKKLVYIANGLSRIQSMSSNFKTLWNKLGDLNEDLQRLKNVIQTIKNLEHQLIQLQKNSKVSSQQNNQINTILQNAMFTLNQAKNSRDIQNVEAKVQKINDQLKAMEENFSLRKNPHSPYLREDESYKPSFPKDEFPRLSLPEFDQESGFNYPSFSEKPVGFFSGLGRLAHRFYNFFF